MADRIRNLLAKIHENPSVNVACVPAHKVYKLNLKSTLDSAVLALGVQQRDGKVSQVLYYIGNFLFGITVGRKRSICLYRCINEPAHAALTVFHFFGFICPSCTPFSYKSSRDNDRRINTYAFLVGRRSG